MMRNNQVYFCDDDEAVRESVALLLEAADYEVAAFSSANDLLDAVSPELNATLLMDVRMPGMDGLEAQAELKRRGVNMPVIIFTGHGDVPMAVRAMRAGAADFIEKPFSEENLLESVRQASLAAERIRRDEAPIREIKEKLNQLTPREGDVLRQLVIGNSNKIIAYELGLSPRTVEIHRARVLEKMEARNLAHLVRMALAAGVDPGIDR